MRALTSITFIASLAVTPALSLAQTQPAQPAQPQTAGGRAEEAQEHIAAAMAAFRAQRFSTAIREFEASYRAAPDADVWYNLARAREMSGDLTGAIADYQRYLRDKVDPPDREEVQRTIRGLQTRIDAQAAANRQTVDGAQMRLVLEGAPHGSRFYLDGVELPANQDPRRVELGDHAVRVTADASQEWAARVRVRAG